MKRYLVAAVLILFLISAAFFAFAARSAQFDGLYGQDPYAYYDYGQQIQNLLVHGQGLGHFYYPVGYPALVGLSFFVTGMQPLGPQLVSILFGAGLTVFAALFTAEIARALGYTARLALIGGFVTWLVLTVSGQVIQSSIVIMSDMPALLWGMLSAWALTVYGRTRQPFWIGLSAFALAWAAMTRWNYAVLALPWALYCLLIWRGQMRWRHVRLAIFIGVITLMPQIVQSARDSDSLLHNAVSQGWSPANAFARDFVTADGTAHYDESVAAYYLKPLTSPYYLSAVLLPFALLGVCALRRNLRAAVLIIGWITVQYGFVIGLAFENIRYGLAYFPPAIILIGLGVAWFLQAVAKRRALSLIVYAAVILSMAFASFATLSTASDLITGFVANKDRDLAAVRWVERMIPERGATVYTLDLLQTMQHYSPSLRPVQVFYESPASMAARLPGDRPAYALFNVWTTEHQWQGKAPWQVYHWLLDQPGLNEIGSYSIYTLYRVR